MKTRIIHALHAFSQNPVAEDYQGLWTAVKEQVSLDDTELQKKSAAILKNIIHNYAAFEVSTIDAFNQRILRSFAKDLGLPVNFEVALNTDEILMEAVEGLIAKAGTDKKLTKVLCDFALSKANEDKSWDITRDLFEISKLLTNENHQAPLQKLKNKSLADFEAFSKKLKLEKKSTAKLIKDSADLFFEIAADNNFERSDFNGKYLWTYFEKIKAENYSYDYEKKWIENLETSSLYPKRVDKDKQNLLDAFQAQICEIFRTSQQANYYFEMLEEISKNLVQLSLLNTINQQVESIKKERGLLLISEFNATISQQVKHQPAPFIYERLGERYGNYFIDEFQDTSRMQWENIIPLIDNKLSGTTPGELAGLMLVGDAKQSIYRWRGGKAEQFIALYNKQEKPFGIEQEIFNLPANYRSGSEIVNFNNRFFKFASGYLNHPDYQNLFENSSQEPKKGDFGYVDITFIEAGKREEEFEIYPQKVLEIIYKLEAKNTPKKDICILTRTRKEGVTVANALSEAGISVVSSETLLLANSPKVNFIMHLLEFSLKPSDKPLKFELFNFLKEKLQIKNPFELLRKNLDANEDYFFSWLQEYEIDFKISAIKNLSLYEAAEHIIRSFNLVETTDAYVQFFLEYVFETTQKNITGLADFLQQWEDDHEKLSIAVPKAEDAVQVMTIHKSKGLEFPVVIYPFANSDFQNTRQESLWIELPEKLSELPVSYISASKKLTHWNKHTEAQFRELLDQNEMDTLNVLYVACTRASHQLYLLSKADLDKNGNENLAKTSGLLIAFLKKNGLWKGNELHYKFGEIPQHNIFSETTSTLIQKKFYSSPTQNKAVNIVTRSGMLWDSKQAEAIEKGEIIHEILANINTEADLEKALGKAVNEGLITKKNLDKIEKVISKIIYHPALNSYFKKGSINYNEREILTSEGKRLRPDRLNIEGTLAQIIDYKTGQFQEKHAKQINEYAIALENIGYTVTNKIVVYLKKEPELQYI